MKIGSNSTASKADDIICVNGDFLSTNCAMLKRP